MQRIVRRYAGAESSRLSRFLQECEAEEMGKSDIIDQLIRAIRAAEAKGVTRYQLSQEEPRIPQSTLTRLMNGDRQSLKIETVELLCRKLGFTLVMKRGRH